MSVNLLRNSKVFFTTNVELVDPNRGQIRLAGHTNATTFEIQVLDDLSFNQTTAVETIAVNEAGTTPIRGQRQFNTALNPVDFNFSTYLRPAKVGTVGGVVTKVTASIGALAFRSWDSTVDVLDSTLQTTYNNVNGITAGQAIGNDYGPNTNVQVALPAATGAKPLILAPIFGTDSTKTTTYEKLVGFRIINGGEGYSTLGTVAATIFDPDSGSEGTSITLNIDTVSAAGSGYKTTCEEAHLWNAMFSPDQPYTSAASFTNQVNGTNGAFKEVPVYVNTHPAIVELGKSNSHQLQRFGMVVVFDQNTFLLDDCSITQASIDFGIDQIATIQWSGQARAIRRIPSPTINFPISGGVTQSAGTGTFTAPLGGGISLLGNFRGKITDAPFIANKLSTVTLVQSIGSFGGTPDYTFAGSTTPGVKSYTIPLTAGNITLQNNITYLTPAYMGAVNQAVTYFTGSRNVTGSLTAYLRSGTGTNYFTADLFSDLVAKINTDSDPEFALQVEIGGRTNATRVELAMPAVVLTIPTVNAESVITSAINFTAQGSDQTNKVFNILEDNEIMIKYFV